ncbi:PEP/pyruvate-binding domain-containing protein [Catelliglobosispora koreensis]|uniref:PEP/pyruvate-binding domain-containing protein n=1 Tax=Catelliglobosispora koreensis TaxID=129052 RepID=UPI0003620C2D|nr:PEP/pyruvate-binding domain-containing protein [Catelliglobosispora koreensis]
MIVPLADAVADSCGGKAAAQATLMRAGLPVPGGFVLPFAIYRSMSQHFDSALLAAIASGLAELGDPTVAVRSSASNEDTTARSAAGQYKTFLGVRGVRAVAEAVKSCWASCAGVEGNPAMAVLIQRHIDADVSGVMFTPPEMRGDTKIEASWGLGPSVVGGTVTPDTFHVSAEEVVTKFLASKATRIDRQGTHLVTQQVQASHREKPALGEQTAIRLAKLGQRIAELLGGAQDVEWSIAGGRIWILQARPVTALPPMSIGTPSDTLLTGTPGSHGTATGTARVVRGPADFDRVRPGDILVSRYTDPGWTPLLRLVSGVVTETGGVLSHAAIVAREHGIPAVLAIANATTAIPDGATITVNGTAGTVTTEEV